MLEIFLTNEDSEFARTVHAKFLSLPGCEHIASETALEFLSACLRLFKPKTVLELGAGIGTVTEALLTHDCSVEQVVATEQNAYCIRALHQNLSNGDDPRLTVVSKPEELRRLSFAADLIVGDGGFYSAEEAECAKVGSIVFAEGHRERLRNMFVNVLNLRGETVEFKQFGKKRGYRLKMRKWRLIYFPAIERLSSKGCWIGRVNRVSDWKYCV